MCAHPAVRSLGFLRTARGDVAQDLDVSGAMGPVECGVIRRSPAATSDSACTRGPRPVNLWQRPHLGSEVISPATQWLSPAPLAEWAFAAGAGKRRWAMPLMATGAPLQVEGLWGRCEFGADLQVHVIEGDAPPRLPSFYPVSEALARQVRWAGGIRPSN